MQRIGDTVFFVRKENSPKELLTGVHGFGHTFPEAYTMWEADVAGSQSHQRIIQYSFGGLKCLVRFECDGYIDNTAVVNTRQQSDPMEPDFDEDELVEALSTLQRPATSNDSEGPLNIRDGGTAVPQASIFDLKTRSGRFIKDIDMQSCSQSFF